MSQWRDLESTLRPKVESWIEVLLRQRGYATSSETAVALSLGSGQTSNGTVLSDDDPLPVAAVADPGDAELAARAGHIHALAVDTDYLSMAGDSLAWLGTDYQQAGTPVLQAKILNVVGASLTDVGGVATLSVSGIPGGGASNQLLGMNAAGGATEWKTLSGTANQITVTHGVGTITLATPQNLHTGATPTFAGLTVSGLTNGRFVLASTGGLLGDSAQFTYGADGAALQGIATDAAAVGLNALATQLTTVNGSSAVYALYGSLVLKIASGVTHSGTAYGLNINAFRGASLGGGDAGTLAGLQGVHVVVGHASTDLYVSPLSTVVTGFGAGSQCLRGTITSLTDFAVTDPSMLSTPSTWASGTGYTAGVSIVKPTVANGRYYICSTTGTSGGGEPVWGTTVGGTTADNSVVWTCLLIPSVTTHYGLHIPALSAAGTSYGIYFAGTGTANGVWWGTQTALYSSGAGVIATNCGFTASQILRATQVFNAGSGNVVANPNVLYFDGSGDYAEVAADKWAELNATANFSWSAWVRWSDITDASNILTIKQVSTSARFSVYSAASVLNVFITNGGATNGSGQFTLTGVVGNGEWHHVALTYDGAQATNALKLLLYIDGVATAFTGFTGTLPATTADLSSAIGYISYTGANAHLGNLNDVRLYNATLSAANVLLVSQGSSAVAGMVHRYQLDEGSGTTATDTGTNAQNAAITGCTWAQLAALGVSMPLPKFALDLPLGTTRDSGVRFGRDCGIWRSAAATLRTEAALIVGGTLTANGDAAFGDASTDVLTCTGRLLVRSVTDAGPMTATAGTQREVVFNTSDSKFYGCTVTGSPATWAALN